MRADLLAWQWSIYAAGHRDRRNLVMHILTVPLFMLGTLGVALTWRWPVAGLAGGAAMGLAMAVQGHGHKREAVAPVPFTGAADVLSRILAEQWITFPRFVLGGGFRKAWGHEPAPGKLDNHLEDERPGQERVASDGLRAVPDFDEEVDDDAAE